jgi:hypothetical protein
MSAKIAGTSGRKSCHSRPGRTEQLSEAESFQILTDLDNELKDWRRELREEGKSDA